ncbi:hypothetical protein [Ferrimonas balearica]|uniref:hypothetical protein n=1 Tax=Ferrimonas balearica TaxID=44012 RepID=UPI001C9A1C04|nr:hypothetical protein [Ferrimonas balearica]MBY5991534.1 hypothetical protein [Ferrimonas balearica]
MRHLLAMAAAIGTLLLLNEPWAYTAGLSVACALAGHYVGGTDLKRQLDGAHCTITHLDQSNASLRQQLEQVETELMALRQEAGETQEARQTASGTTRLRAQLR